MTTPGIATTDSDIGVAPVDPGAPRTDRVAAAARRAALTAGGGWAAVYTLVCLTGQRFSTFYLGIGWQLIPYEILRADPIRSVWYLHIQPPLWNLVIGAIGRWSPLPDALSLQLLQAAFGIAIAAMLAVILVRLRCRPWLAVALALGASVNPEVMRNAFEPTYELATACGLVAVVWALTWATRRPGRALVGVGVFTTAVIMTRSLYHPAWAVVVVALTAWALRRRVGRRQVLAALAVPILAAGAWMGKNEVLFGRATMSSWFGMNLQRAVIPVLPLAEKEQLHAEGKISDVAMIGPFGNYDLYRPVMPPCTPDHDHPALTKELRDNPVVIPNLNYECFLPVYDQAGKDAWAVIRAYPGVWLEGREWSARVWFATNQTAEESPSWVFRRLGNAYRLARLDVPGTISTSSWGTPIYGNLTVPSRFSLLMVDLTLLAGLYGTLHTWRLLRGRAGDGDVVRSAVLAVTGLSAVFTFVVGVVGELGEQARFRTMTDPLVVAVGVYVFLHRFWPRAGRLFRTTPEE